MNNILQQAIQSLKYNPVVSDLKKGLGSAMSKVSSDFDKEFSMYDEDPITHKLTLNPQKMQAVNDKIMPLVMGFSGGIKSGDFNIGKLNPTTYSPPGQTPNEVISNIPQIIKSKVSDIPNLLKYLQKLK